MTELLAVEDLTVDFLTPDGTVHAVRGVSFNVAAGETLGIVGESGSGKSVTMLATMGLLPRKTRVAGSVRFRGEELLGRKSKDMRRFRGLKLAMVFQDPMTSLNPVHKVGKQIAEALLVHTDYTKKAAWARAVELLDIVGIPAPGRRADQYPHEFSGGMRQRAMIAMAIVNDPDILIADEPTTALDVTIQAQVLETLDKVKRELNTSIVLITHDLGVISRMADRVAVMYAGEVVETGVIDDIFVTPRHPYTIGLLNSLPRLDASNSTLTPITGSPPSMVHPPSGCPFHPRCFFRRENCSTDKTHLRDVGLGAHLSACLYAEELSEVAR
jgi:oligopeptide/dipeptide ABC transporter ATP-binding protein